MPGPAAPPRHGSRRRRGLLAGTGLAVVCLLAIPSGGATIGVRTVGGAAAGTHGAAGAGSSGRTTRYSPPDGDGLVTNEYATGNSDRDPAAVTSPEWVATGGSLFSRDGNYWTGVPDSCAPDRYSSRCTNSDAFRLTTRQSYAGSVRVSLAVRQNRRLIDAGCERTGTCGRGVHVWLRYQSEYDLYYAGIQRADGKVVVKRKVPCGNDDGGSDVELSAYAPHPFAPGQWKRYSLTVTTQDGGDVVVRVFDDDVDRLRPVATGVDRGGTNPNWSRSCRTPGRYPSPRYPPIRGGGPIGLRGDHADFSFGEVTVTQASG